MYNTDILTDAGNTITVRRLRLFELDMEVPRPRPEPYTVTIRAYGGEFQQVFNLSIPREEPAIPFEDCDESMREWYDWREYYRYKQGILYYKQVIEVLANYFESVAVYILKNCVPETEWDLIETEDDWNKVYAVALCPEVEFDDLKTVSDRVFMASYDGLPLFNAFENEVEGGLGSYLSIRSWEVKLKQSLHLTDEEYSALGIMERATFIMAERIPDMIGQIDLSKLKKENRARTKKDINNPDAETTSPSSDS